MNKLCLILTLCHCLLMFDLNYCAKSNAFDSGITIKMKFNQLFLLNIKHEVRQFLLAALKFY